MSHYTPPSLTNGSLTSRLPSVLVCFQFCLSTRLTVSLRNNQSVSLLVTTPSEIHFFVVLLVCLTLFLAPPPPPRILQLHSDVDSGNGNIKYILSGEGAGTIFVIDDKTGNIHATKTLDREEQAQYTLTAQAVDRDTNKPLEPPSEFIVKVQDINDNPPEFLHGPYYARVPEMSNVGE